MVRIDIIKCWSGSVHSFTLINARENSALPGDVKKTARDRLIQKFANATGKAKKARKNASEGGIVHGQNDRNNQRAREAKV